MYLVVHMQDAISMIKSCDHRLIRNDGTVTIRFFSVLVVHEVDSDLKADMNTDHQYTRTVR